MPSRRRQSATKIAGRYLRAGLLPGGLADGKSPSDYDPEQLAMGVEVEMEHTDDPDIAREIAMDHLEEIPDYYTRLKEMEAEAGVEH